MEIQSYWSTYSGTYPLNLNEYGVFPEGSAIDIAKQYAEEITGSRDNGRLMTVEEVEALGGSRANNSSSGCPDFINSTDYWLGSASQNIAVWCVWGVGIEMMDDFFGEYYSGRYFSGHGVRPVIEILMSSIS